LGTRFGEWKIEAEWHSFRVVASKVYRGVTSTGRRVRKAKGIPAKLRPAAFGGATVEWLSPNAAIQVLRGADMTSSRTRRLSAIGNSLAWRVEAGGKIRPVHLGVDNPT
jgi:hypothetical protein